MRCGLAIVAAALAWAVIAGLAALVCAPHWLALDCRRVWL